MKKCDTCFFFQDSKCLLSKNLSLAFFCTDKIVKIKGLDDVGKYVELVSLRKNNSRTLLVAICSMLISALLLVKELIDLLNK